MNDTFRRSFPVVTMGGAPLPWKAEQALSEVRVEQSLNVPAAFTLRFNDVDGALLSADQFALGNKVEIGVDIANVVTSLMKGEITGLSAEMDGMTGQEQLVVTGLDGRLRLTRGVKVRDFLNVSDSDVVRKIAGENKLKPEVDTSSRVHDYLLQSVSDFEFIDQRAQACGFEWWVD
ncbi:MAG TPA: hypothetical protein VHL53_08750, partial [Acidimicrobiia bacterium]|nr:hypothetical protein [Acidimicrobiia bacterium]